MNFSNNDTRKEGTGWDAIKKQISKLEKRHAVHIAAYGEGNERRLTGKVAKKPRLPAQHLWAVWVKAAGLTIKDSGHLGDCSPSLRRQAVPCAGPMVHHTLCRGESSSCETNVHNSAGLAVQLTLCHTCRQARDLQHARLQLGRCQPWRLHPSGAVSACGQVWVL